MAKTILVKETDHTGTATTIIAIMADGEMVTLETLRGKTDIKKMLSAFCFTHLISSLKIEKDVIEMIQITRWQESEPSKLYLEYPDIVIYNNEKYLIDTKEIRLSGSKITGNTKELYHIAQKVGINTKYMKTVKPMEK